MNSVSDRAMLVCIFLLINYGPQEMLLHYVLLNVAAFLWAFNPWLERQSKNA